MILGNDPLIIFTFNVPFLGLPFLVVPITLNEDATGLVEKKVDAGISIATETVGTSMVQKSYSDSLSVEFAAKKDSIFSSMVLPLLKKVFTSASVKDLTFGLISGFTYANAYSISYFSGNQYIVGGMLTAFDYGNQDNTDLVNVSMTISAPPVLANPIIGGDVLTKIDGAIVNKEFGTQTSLATVTKPLGTVPSIIAAAPVPSSIIPYPAVPNPNIGA